MLSVFCAPSRYTQDKNATASLGSQMLGLGLRGPALLVAGRSASRLLYSTWQTTFSEARIALRACAAQCQALRHWVKVEAFDVGVVGIEELQDISAAAVER
jgi:hypothetical protein